MNVPVKNFSSGMVSRLAFAIATIGVPDILICSQVSVSDGGEGEYKGETVSVTVERAEGEMCERCWKYGHHHEASSLCPRCAQVLNI